MLLLAGLPASLAQANDKLVVYIECAAPDGSSSQGSGVLVSPDGHVLTARHVIGADSNCTASIGNNTREKRGIRPSYASRNIDDDFDIMVMEFGRDTEERFAFAPVCAMSGGLKGKEIVAKGFHKDSFGAPSTTEGVLSSTAINYDGIVETSAMTVSGKSGGPVFLKGTDNVLGIIAGAQFTAQGVVSYYGMLAADTVIKDLDMLQTPDACDVAAVVEPLQNEDDVLPNTLIAGLSAPEKPEDTAPATGEQVAVADPNFPEHLDGYSVKRIESLAGYFEQNDFGAWEQFDPYGNLVWTFIELGRDEWNLVIGDPISGTEVYFFGEQRLIETYRGGLLVDQSPITAVK